MRTWNGLVIMMVASLFAIPTLQAATPDNNGVSLDFGETDDADAILVVADNGSTYRLTSDSLRDAARAFQSNHAQFAPAARLYFTVTTSDEAGLDGLSVYLRARKADRDGVHTIIDLPVAATGRIEMPVETVVTGQWDLRTNRPRGGIRIKPLILSPGSTIEDRRFGDLRLQCRVSIAFARLSLPVRALAGALGPCGSKRVALYARAPKAVANVTITHYADAIEIRPDAMSFRVPLHDSAIGNEDRLQLIYR